MPPPIHSAASFGIAYRPEADSDRPFTAALYASTRAEEVAQSGWPAEMQSAFLLQQFEAQHSHYRLHYPKAEWLIVEREGMPIGRLYLEEWSREIRIIDISIAAECRGAGIGGAILEDVIADGGARDKAVSIHVEKNNPARRLYERLGFAVIEDKGVYDLMERPPGAADQL